MCLMQAWTCEMSLCELLTLSSLHKPRRNTGIFSGKRTSFWGRAGFFCAEEAQAPCLAEAGGSEARRRSPPSLPSAHGLRAGRPLLGTRPNHSLGPALRDPRVLRTGHNSHRITHLVPPSCNLPAKPCSWRGEAVYFFPLQKIRV